MNTSSKVSFLISLFVIFFMQSCATVQIRKMQVKTKLDNPSILNLCNYGDKQIDFFKQSENLIKGHLVQNEGEEYGYYVIKHDTKQENDTFASIMVGVWFSPLLLLGLPISYKVFYLQAKLYIFDSQGFLVKEYENISYFKHIAGIYYGYNPTKKLEKKYSELYDEIFEIATSDSAEINSVLKKEGAINNKNETIAKANIEAFFKRKGETYKKTCIVSHKMNIQGYTQHENNEIQEKKENPLQISDFNQGIEIGKYYCVQDRNLTIQVLFGIFTLSNGNRSIAVGNYSRHGNKLVVSVYEGMYAGKTFTYIIDDSKHFHHSSEDESWVHESVH